MKRLPSLTLLAIASLFTLNALAQGVADAGGDALQQRGLALADATEAQVIAWRRHIHQNPELSFQEVHTAAYVAAALAKMRGIEVQTGIAKTGIKAVLRGGRPGPVVALRADMDALPVEEHNDLPFKSTTKGNWLGKEVPVSHVCGHDTHVAMLLGAAQALWNMRAELPGTVVFLFQPAEEQGPGPVVSGAPAMVKAGVLDNPKVDVVMGQHINASGPLGIGYRRGSLMASGDMFKISLKGQGGHGSSPWTAKDPTIAAAETVLALQNIASHRIDPLDGPTVVTVGMLQSGNRANVLPDTAEIAGTVRSLSAKNQKVAHENIRLKAQKIAEQYGLTAQVDIDTGYEVLVSDPGATQVVIKALEAAAGPDAQANEIGPRMASEDFGSFGKDRPVVFWNLNASPFGDKAGAPNHSPEFVIDERALRLGVRALVGSTLAYMNARPKGQ
ncbi:amidohydrolase [Variovorax sp. HW608]|uniref:M20 metallopeptidase family protein n=1 Tax=Variovorax sp. HW608 TaxID=1034889 RepID=UPI00081FC82B|nr:amidohydrolase [Variovorax sp. HW608]SCK15198.1 amidohydrolase [Variovorax sp. HW608]